MSVTLDAAGTAVVRWPPSWHNLPAVLPAVRLARVIACAIIAAGAGACQVAGSDVVFRYPLQRAHSTVASSFTTPGTGRYAISLQFAWPIEDRPIAAMINRAATSLRSDTFDFSWEVLEGRQSVAKGSGGDGFRRVIDTPGDDEGDPPTARALVFAEFDGKQGVNYTVRFTPGAGFPTIMKAAPVLQVTQARK